MNALLLGSAMLDHRGALSCCIAGCAAARRCMNRSRAFPSPSSNRRNSPTRDAPSWSPTSDGLLDAHRKSSCIETGARYVPET